MCREHEGAQANSYEILAFLESKISEERQATLDDIEKQVEDFPRMVSELHGGNLPYVFFNGKATEGELKAIYEAAFKDFLTLLKHNRPFRGRLTK